MKLLLLLPYALDTAPSQRYRIEQWRPFLERSGVTVTAATLLTLEEQRRLHAPRGTAGKAWMLAAAFARRARQLRSAGRYDAVWLHRAACPVGPPVLERVLARVGVPVVYEFDDAIWLTHTAAANQRWQFLKFAGKTASLCRMAARVVAGNEFLAEYARRFNSRVSVVPTTVDTDAYPLRARYDREPPLTIGWSGSITTLPHLRLLDGVLQRVARRRPIRARAIGVEEYRVPGVETSAVPWSAARQVEELARFDIGVMPLPDEEWARGKCACKALEYMAVGVPTLSSPVGVNAEILSNGPSGFLAATDDEWVDRILALESDSALRRRLGLAGRETVEARYSARVQAPRVLEILTEVCDTWTRSSGP